MRLVDVNVLVYAHRPDMADHEQYRGWLFEMMDGPEPFAVSDLVLSGFVRVVTNRRIYKDPTPLTTALAAVSTLRNRSNCVPLVPGPRNWAIFTELCEKTGANGNDVADAYHAALAIEHGCEFITTDKGFSRFPGLRWRHPLN
ncbi:type II toxin-antitoxin system VapC family toxin [Actinoallomurus rhizosphaericola]|uniref:type II toxin-antitoxin system VapC family toxin n=1 Tax=Actinoallomurus rhizosphaericola TaxID=2952536 RepID=UPI002091E3F4|nr:type II toxin-antitoxin system VapC family toxin [Actinoallomurus rhizosphaericola]MCO5991776.1 type II toxin-antitoxin system VapC family toxin [Actinoallomurus rhizosphaericola]